MSNASTPQPPSGNASPVPSSSSSAAIATGGPASIKAGVPKPKPTNVFSNDGSFLERIQRSQRAEEEDKKDADALAKKRDFDNRFKNRGKRPPPDASNEIVPPEDPPAKKTKTDKPLTDYEKQVKSYGRSLKDDGMGIRPLVK
ncbi:hypothetical protein PLICRDRAFT_55735 [Plicaturopsis crispa FD-325 SS-3]|nr:hypothetical protein PLICRDRAFT_55735 [Plicaturopsis crispa FD-325 SS-3]